MSSVRLPSCRAAGSWDQQDNMANSVGCRVGLEYGQPVSVAGGLTPGPDANGTSGSDRLAPCAARTSEGSDATIRAASGVCSFGTGAERIAWGFTIRQDRGIGMKFTRITHNPAVMGGKPCIRGLRVTVGTVVGLLASGESRERILQAYPYLEAADLDEALTYAAWRLEEREEELVVK